MKKIDRFVWRAAGRFILSSSDLLGVVILFLSFVPSRGGKVSQR